MRTNTAVNKEEHVAWLRYDRSGTVTRIVCCDSDAPGAFRVYRHPKTAGSSLTDEQIRHLVNRFLCYPFPDDLNPDGGISYKRSETSIKFNHPGPVGTNLLTADQAEAMVRYMVEGMPTADSSVPDDAECCWFVESASDGKFEGWWAGPPKGEGGWLTTDPMKAKRYSESEARAVAEALSYFPTPFRWSRWIATEHMFMSPSLPRCPVCLDRATYQTPDGKYWCSRAHWWNHVECGECKGMRVRTYPETPLGHTETCRRCSGAATADSSVPEPQPNPKKGSHE